MTPYLVPFARAVASGFYRRVVAVTAAQAGKTDSVLDIIGTRLDQRPAPIIYVGPTRDFLIDQFEPRLMQLFDQAPALSAKVLRGRRMKKTVKWVAGSRVRLAYAGSATALKSDPAALALIDEYDAMVANVQRQGDPLGLVEARGETYADFVTGVTSTPTLGTVDTEVDPVSHLEFWKRGEAEEIESAIWQLWQEGTRHHWAWPCPRCGEYFIPRMKLLEWEKGLTPTAAGRTAYLRCPRCDAHIDDGEKATMNDRGVYVSPSQWVDKEGNVLGPIPDNFVCSFWASGLASPFASWGKRVEDLLVAEASGLAGRMQNVANAGFGELFSPGGGEVPEWREVMALKLPYPRGSLPTGVVFLIAAVDVQKNRLVYVVRGWGARATSWLVDHGELWGDTTKLEVWGSLSDLLGAHFGDLPVKVAFVDSGFRPGKPESLPENRVYDFCRRHQRFVFPTKGADVMSSPLVRRRIEVKPTGGASPYGLELVRLSTDWWKLWVHERIRWPVSEAGAWFLHEEVDEAYCRQIVSEARTKSPNGRPVWIARSRENHFLDCEAMAAAAAFMLGAHRIGVRMKERPATPANQQLASAVAISREGTASRFADFARRLNNPRG